MRTEQPELDNWTETGFMYVQRQSCGCAVGAIVEFDGPYREFTAEAVKEAILRGCTVERVANSEVKFGPCACIARQEMGRD